MKKHPEQDVVKTNIPKDGRRKVLKTMAVSGGIVAGASQVVPKKWVTPIIDSVLLPVHAQTSVVSLSGTFTGTVSNNVAFNEQNSPSLISRGSGINHLILEFLVPSAEASHAQTGWCANTPTLTFDVDEDTGIVTICASWDADDGTIIDQAMSTLSGNDIADFLLTGGDDGVDSGGGISITGCVISADGQTITGSSMANGDDGATSCMGSFTLVRTETVFSCSPNNEAAEKGSNHS